MLRHRPLLLWVLTKAGRISQSSSPSLDLCKRRVQKRNVTEMMHNAESMEVVAKAATGVGVPIAILDRSI